MINFFSGIEMPFTIKEKSFKHGILIISPCAVKIWNHLNENWSRHSITKWYFERPYTIQILIIFKE